MAELLGEEKALGLSDRIRARRLEAASGLDEGHHGRCLTLLLDDMDHLPPDLAPNNRAMVEWA